MISQINKKSSNRVVKINHVAIIMDGNRRWAKKKLLRTEDGHKNGIINAISLLKSINKDKLIKVKYITLYVFAADNWKRSVSEINYLFKYIKDTYSKFENLSLSENFKINHFGSKKRLPNSIIKIINNVSVKTENNYGMNINLAFNYSGRDEILNAIKAINYKKQNISNLSAYLYSRETPDPDLIIRTGGEKRMSDFLIWQSAYSELYFTKVLWPDFKIRNFRVAINDYINRNRNYGK